MSAGAALAAAHAHCAARARRDDPDRFLATLFMKEGARAPIHALLAFNAEIARVCDTVTQPMLGEIRFQWWRDAITQGTAGGNPVAVALLDAIARFKLDASRLLALIEARSFDLYDDPMPSIAAYEAYIRDTSATLSDLTAQILAPGFLAPGFPPHPATDAAGRAFAITGLLRALPWQVMKGQLFIPLDLLEKFQLPPEAVLAHRMSPALGLVLNALRARARVHLNTMMETLPTCAAPEACLPAFLCEPYLKAMERADLNPFETPIERASWRKLWVMWRAARGM